MGVQSLCERLLSVTVDEYPKVGLLSHVALLVFVLFLNHSGHIINNLYIVAFLIRPFCLNP